jgi:hypothetical protein
MVWWGEGVTYPLPFTKLHCTTGTWSDDDDDNDNDIQSGRPMKCKERCRSETE